MFAVLIIWWSVKATPSPLFSHSLGETCSFPEIAPSNADLLLRKLGTLNLETPAVGKRKEKLLLFIT